MDKTIDLFIWTIDSNLERMRKIESLTKKQRVINTFEYKDLDRFAIYDKIHNIDIIEYVTGERINEKNAEDVTCRALGQLCDMVRHVAIPYRLDEYMRKDEDVSI